jgi:hypothetical protein
MLQSIKKHVQETIAEGERKATPMQRAVIILVAGVATAMFLNLPILWQ